MSLESNLNDLIKSTNDGEILWNRDLSSNFYYIEKDLKAGNKIKVSVQKLSGRDKIHYYFRILDSEKAQPIVDLENIGPEKDVINQLLVKLYDTVSGENDFVNGIFSEILKNKN